jgi:integrase
MKQAEAFKVKVEQLVGGGVTDVIDVEVSRWLAERDDVTYEKLVAVGLAKPRTQGKTTLRQLLDAFFAALHVKPITVIGYKKAERSLVEFFGAAKPIRDIDTLQADQWRASMVKEGLAEATISKRVKIARQIFGRGVKWKMITENPLADVKAGSQTNRARLRFISREDSEKVLEACPDVEWRLLFALSRYGGLRCPSEHLALKWSDVDWAKGRLPFGAVRRSTMRGRTPGWFPSSPNSTPS